MEDLQICTIMDIMDKFGCETLEELELFIEAYNAIDELGETLRKIQSHEDSDETIHDISC